MAKSRLIGDYPVIGIRPAIDGRRGYMNIRGSLEEQTMSMAKAPPGSLRKTCGIPTANRSRSLLQTPPSAVWRRLRPVPANSKRPAWTSP